MIKKYLDDVIFVALKKKRKVSLFLCKYTEGGFGIKIDGKIIERNIPWETFGFEIEEKVGGLE